MTRFTSAFTIDLEDGISIAMKKEFGIKSEISSRVVKNTDLILELINSQQIKATFFTVGSVACKYPELIKKIHSQGHEIAVHGYSHICYDHLNYQQVYEEINKTKQILENITGEEVIGHRAPWFSIKNNKRWIMDILSELGFIYDSSFLSDKKGSHWCPEYQKGIFEYKTSDKKILEIPISTITIIGRTIPFSGGSYLRMLPLLFLKFAFNKIEKKRPVILYIHPYELDTEIYPEYYLNELMKIGLFKQLKIKSYWINRSKTTIKLNHLIENHGFTTIKNLIS